MKRVVLFLLLLICVPLVNADETPTVEPVNIIELITDAESKTPAIANAGVDFWNASLDMVGRLSPGISTSYDALSDDWFGSATVGLFDFSDDHRHLGGVIAGIGIRRQGYVALTLDLPSIFGAYTPDSIKANSGFSPAAWGVLGKLLSVHAGIGYQAEYMGQEGRVIAPIGFGGRLEF